MAPFSASRRLDYQVRACCGGVGGDSSDGLTVEFVFIEHTGRTTLGWRQRRCGRECSPPSGPDGDSEGDPTGFKFRMPVVSRTPPQLFDATANKLFLFAINDLSSHPISDLAPAALPWFALLDLSYLFNSSLD